jgi:alpha-methylacyl-CoA racemase
VERKLTEALPLQGIVVLELAGLGPATHAGMMLADLGARVIRIVGPGERDWGTSDFQLRGRETRTLDLKSDAGRSAFFELMPQADVLLEGFRPGVTERLGIGPEDCEGVNRRLVYARVTGWGQSGTRAHEAGHDLNYLALTGVLNAIARPGERPMPPLNLIGDFGGGSMLVTVGILSALLERERTWRGRVIDAAIVDGVSLLAQMMWQYRATGRWDDRPGTNRLDGGAPYYDTYRCADDRFVAVAALEPKFWQNLLLGLGVALDLWPERESPEAWPQIRVELTQRFLERSRDEWAEVFGTLDACVTPVLSFAEAERDPHLVSRGTLRHVDLGMEAGPAPRFY